MPSVIKTLTDKQLISPPSFLPCNVHFETIMGSVAYGVSSDTSDCDIYGFCIPPQDMIFPHLAGEIDGFGREKKRFHQYQIHHVQDGEKSYDLSIYSIVRFFHLCMENNPNMINALFTPTNCVLHCTSIGNLVRDNRRMFLHKGCWPKFKGYAYSQMHKMSIKNPEEGSKRYEDIKRHGYDCKFAYHIVRLLDEAEQILTLGDLDLQRSREVLKSIRRGEWTEQQIRDYFASKEKDLETVYANSTLPWGPDEDAIKALLLNCLEQHYGSLDKAIVMPNRYESALREIREICEKSLAR